MCRRNSKAVAQTLGQTLGAVLHPLQPLGRRSFVELDLVFGDLVTDRSVLDDLGALYGVRDEVCVEWRLVLAPEVRMHSAPAQFPSVRAGGIEVQHDLADRVSRHSCAELALTVMPLEEIEVPGDPVASSPSGIADNDGGSDLAREMNEGVLLVL